MARGFYLGIDGVAREGSEIYTGVSGVARKVVKAYASVNGVAQQVWPRYAWKRYSLKDLVTYHWDKYNAVSTTSYTGKAIISYASGSMTVSWSPTYSRNDPPRLDDRCWDNCVGGTWNGWDPPGQWVGQGVNLSRNRYYVTNIEDASGANVKLTYSRVARAETKTTYTKGLSQGQVSSTNPNAYPADGVSGGSWYTSAASTSETVQGDYIDTVYGDEGEYPDNGILGDYWYVKVER